MAAATKHLLVNCANHTVKRANTWHDSVHSASLGSKSLHSNCSGLITCRWSVIFTASLCRTFSTAKEYYASSQQVTPAVHKPFLWTALGHTKHSSFSWEIIEWNAVPHAGCVCTLYVIFLFNNFAPGKTGCRSVATGPVWHSPIVLERW